MKKRRDGRRTHLFSERPAPDGLAWENILYDCFSCLASGWLLL